MQKYIERAVRCKQIRSQRGYFDRSRLPDPFHYYIRELGLLKTHGIWVKARCCFHDDHVPSLSVNLKTGQFKCFACGASGGDVLAFQMLRYGQDFKNAAKALGAWRDL